jgi:hypothetical protein
MQYTGRVILNHVNPNVHGIERGEARHRKYKDLNMAALRPATFPLTNSSIRSKGKRKVKISLLQAVETPRVARDRGFHIT